MEMSKVKMAVIVADEKAIIARRTREYNEGLHSILNELVKQQQNILYVDECNIRGGENKHPNNQLGKLTTQRAMAEIKKKIKIKSLLISSRG